MLSLSYGYKWIIFSIRFFTIKKYEKKKVF